jgi:hypothetical protein
VKPGAGTGWYNHVLDVVGGLDVRDFAGNESEAGSLAVWKGSARMSSFPSSTATR